MMNKYVSPTIDIIVIEAVDVITASAGTETPIKGVGGGIWDLDINISIEV